MNNVEKLRIQLDEYDVQAMVITGMWNCVSQQEST